MLKRTARNLCIYAALILLAVVSVGRLAAIEEPERFGVAELEFRHPDLEISKEYKAPIELPAAAASQAAADLAALGAPAGHGRIDTRGRRWAAISLSKPLVPGRGLGNTLYWADLGEALPANDEAYRAATGRAFRGYLKSNAARLRIDVDELAGQGLTTASNDQTVVKIHVPRRFQGLRVRDSYLSGIVNRGNLVLFGTDNWGDIDVSTTPTFDAVDSIAAVQSHVDPFTITGNRGKNELILVPLAKGKDVGKVPHGQGYTYRLAWLVQPTFEDDFSSYEGLVDAHTGEVISFEDTNRYAEVKGGVLPVSNDGMVPDGVEQAGWPMPYQDTTLGTTDTGGNVAGSGSMTATFFGPYVNINDNCGSDSLTQSDNIDWGTSAGTDCDTPGFGGAGNTHASRTGFYELNKIIEMGRGQLPSNSWLQARLTSNMNINSTCNAFWNGTVNFYQSGGGCSNTGEIAGVFDHEWGHGMDANDATPGIASPSGEGIADIYTALRLNSSCIGRNFRLGTNCSGNGDPCLSCDGVRDIDYAKRQSGNPHDYSWSNSNCGGSVHCVGGVYSEAVWSLWKRNLQSAPFNYDNNTAHEITTRLTYIGAGATGTWFSGGPPFGGCSASSGYKNYLAADDDDGDLSNGTPHMTAIYAAFNDQEIACNDLTVQNSGCASAPTTAPSVSATAADKSVGLSWGTVSGATKYQVFRTEGVFACDFGKVKLGETAGTTWNDSDLQNGRAYSYVVVPIGLSDACMGPASACTTSNPAAGPNLAANPASAALSITSGDADDFIDNCETGTMTFDVTNTGLGALTNVRITSIAATSHPSTTIDTALPAAVSPSGLAEGATGTGGFDFTAGGLAFGDTLIFDVEVTADELSGVRTATLTIQNAESDFQVVSSHTWDFESDLDEWKLIQGTFGQTTSGGGANGSSGFVASSANLDNQCDQVRSPIVRLTSSSQLTVETNYDIELFSSGQWWDRANVAVLDGGVRGAVNPDGGRLYNASGAGASCVTANQGGWADDQTTWAQSSWSTSALGSAGLAGKSVQLDIAYGTDAAAVGRGFWFDQVTLTDFELLVADTQSDTCGSPAVCGDNTKEGSEVCDGSDLDGETCASQGCSGGTLACQSDCSGFDTSSCTGCSTCNNNGTCESGEDCNSCPNDCISGSTSGAVCGNGVCEAGDGEDCVSCAADCNGLQKKKPSNRFCCGDGDGQNPLSCSDATCSTGGWSCTDTPQPGGSFCCGQNGCEAGEDSFNCALDCGPAPFCGDTFCDPGEDQCSCALDCGTPPTSEAGFCSDGVDNDCGGGTDCADADCGSDPACQECTLGQKGDSCTANADCCSNKCRGPRGSKSCK